MDNFRFGKGERIIIDSRKTSGIRLSALLLEEAGKPLRVEAG